MITLKNSRRTLAPDLETAAAAAAARRPCALFVTDTQAAALAAARRKLADAEAKIEALELAEKARIARMHRAHDLDRLTIRTTDRRAQWYAKMGVKAQPRFVAIMPAAVIVADVFTPHTPEE